MLANNIVKSAALKYCCEVASRLGVENLGRCASEDDVKVLEGSVVAL